MLWRGGGEGGREIIGRFHKIYAWNITTPYVTKEG